MWALVITQTPPTHFLLLLSTILLTPFYYCRSGLQDEGDDGPRTDDTVARGMQASRKRNCSVLHCQRPARIRSEVSAPTRDATGPP